MSQYNHNPHTIGESPASGPAPTTAGHHKHDILNKLDPRVDSTRDKHPLPQQDVPSGTYGPHSSRIANKLDPRVDSDLDGRGGAAGMGTQQQRGMGGGMMGSHQGGYSSGAGMTGAGAGRAGTGVGGMTNQGYGPGNVGAHGEVREGTYGPHKSRMANAMDPRVDSDRDGGMMHGGTEQQQGGYPHDGRVGGGAGLGGQQHQGMVGGTNLPGPAPTTGGPHKSDLMNKLDPRVDSKTGMMKESGSGYSERRGI